MNTTEQFITNPQHELTSASPVLPYEERLENGVKVVIMGPPHSGKSVFIDTLIDHLDADLNATMLSGCPDGEGLWLQDHYAKPEVAALRRKGAFTPEFVQFASESVRNFRNPLAIVDIGGRITDENRQIAAGATHAIILAGNLSEVSAWQEFADELSLPVIAKLHSHYAAPNDTILKVGERVVASTHFLERGTGAELRPSVGYVAEMLTALAHNNTPYWKHETTENKTGANEVEFEPRRLARELGRDEKTVTLPSGQVVSSVAFEPEDALQMRTLLEGRVYGKAVTFDGFAKGWEFTALAFAALENGAESVAFNSPNGAVQIGRVPITETAVMPNGTIRTVRRNDGSVLVDISLDGPISPDDMVHMQLPAVQTGRVVISGRIPHWLRASVAVSYTNACPEIAIFTPGEGELTVWATNAEKVGDLHA